MRENNRMWQAAAGKNGKAMVLRENQGNIPAQTEPQKGHRGYLHRA